MSKVFNAEMCVLLRLTWRMRDLYVRGRKLTCKVLRGERSPTNVHLEAIIEISQMAHVAYTHHHKHFEPPPLSTMTHAE